MAIKNMDYWYDDQIRRYLLQLVRVFSHFQVRERTSSGDSYNRVPVIWGRASRDVASIIRKNSENSIIPSPQIALSINDIRYIPERAQAPFYQDVRQTVEREFNTDTGQYEVDTPGNMYTIERYMPVPYNMIIQIDILTSNTDDKFQLLEQMMVLFNPGIELQSNSNAIDWTSVFYINLTDVRWASYTIPNGTDDELDVATLQFEVPIWISPPAKVKRQSIIQRIVADIHSTDSVEGLGYENDYYDFFDALDEDAQVIVTPGDYLVEVVGTSAVLVNQQGQNMVWANIIEQQGEITNTSLLNLNISNDVDSTDNLVIGSVSEHPTNSSILVFNLDSDTLPSDTLADVDMIIDPQANYPGDGTLPAASSGQRYLITDDISAVGDPNWGLDASVNDIIQYDGSDWSVVFDASAATAIQYVTNTNTGTQYKWDLTNGWIGSYEGSYNPGYWFLSL